MTKQQFDSMIETLRYERESETDALVEFLRREIEPQ